MGIAVAVPRAKASPGELAIAFLVGGLLVLAAAQSVRFETNSKPEYLVDSAGIFVMDTAGHRLADNCRIERWRVVVGDVRLPLPGSITRC